VTTTSGSAAPTAIPIPIGFQVSEGAEAGSIDVSMSPGVHDELLKILQGGKIASCPAARIRNKKLWQRQAAPMCSARLSSFAQAVSEDPELAQQFNQLADAVESQTGIDLAGDQMLAFGNAELIAAIIETLPASAITLKALGIYASMMGIISALSVYGDSMWVVNAGKPTPTKVQSAGATPATTSSAACPTETDWVCRISRERWSGRDE
jgi:hypothetical protein